MAKLQITLPDGREDSHDLVEETVTIGRAPENSIIIEDVSVSSRHAKLTRGKGGEYRLEDLGSTNGTRLNGEPLKEAKDLSDEDQIRFGKVDVAYFSSERKGAARPLPEADKVEAKVGEGSQKPAGFGNVSPFKKRQKAKDPVGTAVMAFAFVAIAAFVLAILRTLMLTPPN